jgi:hypothetical protein
MTPFFSQDCAFLGMTLERMPPEVVYGSTDTT